MLRHTNRIILGLSVLSLVALAWAGSKDEGKSAAATVYTPASSIAKDCSRDVTNELNSFINGVPNGSTIEFSPGGCYRIDNILLIHQRSNLVIDGKGATFKAMTDGRELVARYARTRSQFRVLKSEGITLKNLIVYGANKNGGTGDNAYVEALEAQHAFDILSSKSVLIDSVQAYQVYGDFVYIGNQGGYLSDGVTVRNSRFEKNGRQGMAITGGRNVLIEKNYMDHTRRSTFDIEPNNGSGVVENIMIKNNEFGPSERLLFFANGGACARNANVTFEANKLNGRPFEVSSNAPAGCTVKRGPYYFIGNTSNQGDGNPNQGLMNFSGIDGLYVRSNNIPVQGKRGMRLVRAIRNATNIEVTGNRISEASGSLLVNETATVTNYCFSDNLIGSPLAAETSNRPCQVAPPPPPPDDPPPPVDDPPPPASEEEIEQEIEEELEGTATTDTEYSEAVTTVPASVNTGGGNKPPQSSGGGQTTPGEQQTTNSNEPSETSSEGESSSEQTEVASRPKSWSQKVLQAVKDIPPTLGEAVTNPTSLPRMVLDEEKQAALFAFAGVLTVTTGSTEAAWLMTKGRASSRNYKKQHGLDKLDDSSKTPTMPMPNDAFKSSKASTSSSDPDSPHLPGEVYHPQKDSQDSSDPPASRV